MNDPVDKLNLKKINTEKGFCHKCKKEGVNVKSYVKEFFSGVSFQKESVFLCKDCYEERCRARCESCLSYSVLVSKFYSMKNKRNMNICDYCATVEEKDRKKNLLDICRMFNILEKKLK